MNKKFILILSVFAFLLASIASANAAVTISSCGQDIKASENYLLNQSITSTATCLVTNSSNVEIDCAGNTITYGTAGTASSFGISASHPTTSQVNLTIKNCIITKPSSAGASGRGISLTRFANSTITNNAIMTNGTSSNMGIYIITGSNGNNISRNTIVTSGTAASNYGISLNAGSADTSIEYNTITSGKGTATTDNYGIYASDPRESISNNVINTFGSGDSNYGIYSSAAAGTRIINNTIYTSGATGNNRGIYVYSSDSNFIANNTINTTGQASPGIYLLSSGSVNVLSNKINSTADAIYMSSTVLIDFTLANISGDNTRFGRNITVYGGGALTLPCPNNTIIDNPPDGALKFFGCNNITVQNWYRPNRDTDGLLFVNSDYNKIINNTINGGINGLDMVNTAGMCDNNTISNNTFSSFGYIDAYAIRIYGTYNIITGNNLSTSGVTSGNNAINIQNDFNNITNNIITTGGTSGNIGINLESGAVNNLIQNNTIATSGTSGNTGVYFVSTNTGNIIRNNTITTTGTTSGNLGIRLVTNSDNNIIESNTFYTKGLTSGNNGLDLSSSDNNLFRFNNVYAGYGVGTTDNDAISLDTSKNNTFMNNILFANGTATSITSSAIFLYRNSVNNTFANNVVIKSVGNAIELDFLTTYPHRNIFQNNSLNNISGSDLFFLDKGINDTALINQPIGIYNFTGIGGTISVENTQFGKIAFTSLVNGSGNNLSSDVQIGFNFAQVSPSKKGLNATANISFYNLATNFYYPLIRRDGIYECNATTVPACINFTSLNAGNISFSVTGWSNYSVMSLSDNLPPVFSNYIESPASSSSYASNQDYRFNVTITEQNPASTWIEFNSTNYTSATNISNNYSFSISNLAAGTYSYRWWANDTVGNLNSSGIRYYAISKADGDSILHLLSSAGWGYNYGTESIFSCYADYGTSNLYIDLVEIPSPATRTLSAGTHNVKCNISESQNYTSGFSQNIFSVSKISSQVSLTFDKTSPQTYGTAITPTCSIISGVGNANLSLNGNTITSGLALNLGAGTWNFNCSLQETQNYTQSSNYTQFTISNASQTAVLSINESSPVIYGARINATCNGDLFRNSVNVNSEKSQSVLLGAGSYIYSCQLAESQNYSYDDDNLTFVINKAIGNISLKLNGQENNITIDYPQQYNITAATLYGNVIAYLNGSDITLNNGLNITPSRAAAYYNITAFSSGDENHSQAWITSWLNVTLDVNAPSITIYSPQDGASYGYNTSLPLNFSASDLEGHLDSCWYNLDNGENKTLLNCGNTTFNASIDGSYTLYVYANDSLGNLGIKNSTFSISVGSPTITLSSPIGIYLNSRDVIFRYNPRDSDLGSCELWGDFSGEFKLNQTQNSPLNDTENTFNLTLPDGTYKWNVKCNDSQGHSSFNGNKTFYVDTISPNLAISEPTGKKSSRTGIPLVFSVSDASPVSCKYNVYRGTNLEISNTTISCSQADSFNVTIDADFIINLYANDYAGNTNFSGLSFSVSTSTTPSGDSGGGGGGGGSIGNYSSSKKSSLGLSKISDLIVGPGDSKRISLQARNIGTSYLNGCKFSGSGENSGWVSSGEIIGLSAGEIKDITLNLKVPESAGPGRYAINISAVCQEASREASFFAEILEKKLGLEIIDAKRDRNNQIKVTYSLAELSNQEQDVEVYILAMGSRGEKLGEIRETRKLAAGAKQQFEALMEITGSARDSISILINVNSGIASGFVQEDVFLGAPLTGLASLSLSEVSGYVIVILVIISGIACFFIVRRIIRFRKMAGLHKVKERGYVKLSERLKEKK